MAQAFQVADRIVVLRHGRVAGDVATERTSPDEIVRMITGDIGRLAARGSMRVEEGSRL
jgi:D-xylose transport system ATP-binding protein